jgi:hypothetical protein
MTPTSTTTTRQPGCAEIRQSQQAFNDMIDARTFDVLLNTPPQLQAMVLFELQQMRASGNAAFERQLALAGCPTTTTTSTTTTGPSSVT